MTKKILIILLLLILPLKGVEAGFNTKEVWVTRFPAVSTYNCVGTLALTILNYTCTNTYVTKYATTTQIYAEQVEGKEWTDDDASGDLATPSEVGFPLVIMGPVRQWINDGSDGAWSVPVAGESDFTRPSTRENEAVIKTDIWSMWNTGVPLHSIVDSGNIKATTTMGTTTILFPASSTISVNNANFDLLGGFVLMFIVMFFMVWFFKKK